MATIEQKYKDGYVPFRLPNVEVWWAQHLFVPDTAFGANKYHVETHLSDALANQLRNMGFTIGNKEKDGEVIARNVFKPKTDAINKKTGQKNRPPKVVGPDGKTLWDPTVAIGNGSICNIICDAKAWQVRGSWQLSSYLKEVQVVKHVPYAGSSFEDLTEEADVPF